MNLATNDLAALFAWLADLPQTAGDAVLQIDQILPLPLFQGCVAPARSRH